LSNRKETEKARSARMVRKAGDAGLVKKDVIAGII